MAANVNGFELYIWPPAPGTPSLDPECIAVIVFLTSILPRDAGLSIITAYDASVSPSRTLPCLRRDDICIHGGYRSFVKFFQLPGQGLDEGLGANKQAEALALGHHAQSVAQPLLDYHLYVNSESYSAVTHRAHAQHSFFPFGWLYPPHRFDKAERRAASIGLVDQPTLKGDAADATNDPMAGGHMEGSTNPSLLFARSQKAQKRLKEQVGTARFRLQTAIDALCEPLNDALSNSEGAYLVDGSIRSIDCHIYGYLSLLLNTHTPDTTAPDELRKRWPRVAQYVQRLASNLSSPQIRELSSDSPKEVTSHYTKQAPPTILKRASVFLTSITNLIIPSQTRSQVDYTLRTLPVTVPLLIFGIFAATTGVTTFAYAAHTLLAKKIPRDALNQRDLVFARPRTGLGAMGASGAALAALLGPPSGPVISGSGMQQERNEGGVKLTEEVRREEPRGVEVAEVDIEVEGT